MPWAANIAKTMTSNGKQFTVTREMLTGVARDQSVQLKVAWYCRRNIRAFFKICFCFYQAFLLYNKYIESQCFPRRSRGKQNSLFPSGPVIKCILSIGPAFSNNEVQQGGKRRNWELRSVTAERSVGESEEIRPCNEFPCPGKQMLGPCGIVSSSSFCRNCVMLHGVLIFLRATKGPLILISRWSSTANRNRNFGQNQIVSLVLRPREDRNRTGWNTAHF